jgi:hypothetical protein
LADYRDKKIHPRDWNSSSKPDLIKEKAVAEPKPFKATDPFLAITTTTTTPTVSTKVKDGTTGMAKKVKKTQEPIARPGLVSRVWIMNHGMHPFSDVNQDVGGICILSSIKG